MAAVAWLLSSPKERCGKTKDEEVTRVEEVRVDGLGDEREANDLEATFDWVLCEEKIFEDAGNEAKEGAQARVGEETR